MVNVMKSSVRFLSISSAITVLLMLPGLSFSAPSQTSTDDELSEIVPTAVKRLESHYLFPTYRHLGASDYNEDNSLADSDLAPFLTSDNVTLFSLEPDSVALKSFHGYTVLGKASISREETALILKDLKQSLNAVASLSLCSDCFHPHHALRAEMG